MESFPWLPAAVDVAVAVDVEPGRSHPVAVEATVELLVCKEASVVDPIVFLIVSTVMAITVVVCWAETASICKLSVSINSINLAAGQGTWIILAKLGDVVAKGTSLLVVPLIHLISRSVTTLGMTMSFGMTYVLVVVQLSAMPSAAATCDLTAVTRSKHNTIAMSENVRIVYAIMV